MHQVALLRLGRLGEPLDHLGVLGVDETAASCASALRTSTEKSPLLVNVLRRGGAVGWPPGDVSSSTSRVERERELGQVARAELRALAQVVERVDAAERGQLLLVVDVLDSVRGRRAARRLAEATEQSRAGGMYGADAGADKPPSRSTRAARGSAVGATKPPGGPSAPPALVAVPSPALTLAGGGGL